MPASISTIYRHNGISFAEHSGFDDDEHIIDSEHVLQYQNGKAVLVCFKLCESNTEVENFMSLKDGLEHIVCKCGKNLVWTKQPGDD